MANRIARILLFSDPHFSVDSRIEEEKWFPPICNFFQKVDSKFKSGLVKKFLKFWDKLTQKWTKTLFRKAIKASPYSFVIGLGDYTPVTNESGMITEKSVEQFQIFEKLYKEHFGPEHSLFVWGDHDVGYRFNVSKRTGIKIGSEKGGISIESISKAERLLGNPYGSFHIGPAKFIFLSTNLIRAHDSTDRKIQLLIASQRRWIADELTMKNDSAITFLLVHDPTSFQPNSLIMDAMHTANSQTEKLVIIHGHFHAEFSSFLTQIFYAPFRKLNKNFKTVLVPAPWGMFGIGKGFKVLNLFDDGSYRIEKHSL